MLRLIIQTKRKYKKIEKQDIEPKDEKEIVALMKKAVMVRAQSLKMMWTVK